MKYVVAGVVLGMTWNLCALTHRFLCVDNGANRLIHVDQLREGHDWSVELPAGARDMQLVGADTVLVSHGRQGTAAHRFEFDAANQVVWQWGDHTVARQVMNVLVIDEALK